MKANSFPDKAFTHSNPLRKKVEPVGRHGHQLMHHINIESANKRASDAEKRMLLETSKSAPMKALLQLCGLYDCAVKPVNEDHKLKAIFDQTNILLSSHGVNFRLPELSKFKNTSEAYFQLAEFYRELPRFEGVLYKVKLNERFKIRAFGIFDTFKSELSDLKPTVDMPFAKQCDLFAKSLAKLAQFHNSGFDLQKYRKLLFDMEQAMGRSLLSTHANKDGIIDTAVIDEGLQDLSLAYDEGFQIEQPSASLRLFERFQEDSRNFLDVLSDYSSEPELQNGFASIFYASRGDELFDIPVSRVYINQLLEDFAKLQAQYKIDLGFDKNSKYRFDINSTAVPMQFIFENIFRLNSSRWDESSIVRSLARASNHNYMKLRKQNSDNALAITEGSLITMLSNLNKELLSFYDKAGIDFDKEEIESEGALKSTLQELTSNLNFASKSLSLAWIQPMPKAMKQAMKDFLQSDQAIRDSLLSEFSRKAARIVDDEGFSLGSEFNFGFEGVIKSLNRLTTAIFQASLVEDNNPEFGFAEAHSWTPDECDQLDQSLSLLLDRFSNDVRPMVAKVEGLQTLSYAFAVLASENTSLGTGFEKRPDEIKAFLAECRKILGGKFITLCEKVFRDQKLGEFYEEDEMLATAAGTYEFPQYLPFDNSELDAPGDKDLDFTKAIKENPSILFQTMSTALSGLYHAVVKSDYLY